MRTGNRKGFTLIELLIVIAIIGILAAVLIPNLLNARRLAQERAAQAYSAQVYTAINAWLSESVNHTLATLPEAAQTCAPGADYEVGEFSVNDPGTGSVLSCAIATADEVLEVTVVANTPRRAQFLNGQEDGTAAQ